MLQQQKCCMLIINKTKNLTLWCRTIKRESKTIETLHTDSGTFVTVHRHPRSITPHNVKDQSGLPCNRETNIDPNVSPHPPPQHRPAISWARMSHGHKEQALCKLQTDLLPLPQGKIRLCKLKPKQLIRVHDDKVDAISGLSLDVFSAELCVIWHTLL